MKKHVLSLMMVCCLAIAGVQAQNAPVGLSLQTAPDFAARVAADNANREMVLISYAPDDLESVSMIGLGMAFAWGSMFPAEALASYAGTTLVGFGFVDTGDPQYAGNYQMRIYLGGDTQGAELVRQQDFSTTGQEAGVMPYTLDEPLVIDGTQNLWMMVYHDGTLQYCAPCMGDMGDPNNRWIQVDSYGWFDVQTAVEGADDISWLVWGVIDDAVGIISNSAEVSVYPNPTSGNVTVQANGMSEISIYNTLGQRVYNAPASSNIETLDMSQYQAGVYVVRVATEEGVAVQRVTVK